MNAARRITGLSRIGQGAQHESCHRPSRDNEVGCPMDVGVLTIILAMTSTRVAKNGREGCIQSLRPLINLHSPPHPPSVLPDSK